MIFLPLLLNDTRVPFLGLRAKGWIEVVRKVLERKDITEEKSLEDRLWY